MSILDENSGVTNDNLGLRVNGEMKHNWLITSKWAMFFAIVGFIYIAFSIFTIGSSTAALQTIAMLMGDNPIIQVFMSFIPYLMFITIGMLAVMFFINFFHLRFATKIQQAIKLGEQDAFRSAWQNLRNHYRLFGIVTIVLIAMYVVMVIIVISIGVNNSTPLE